MKKLILTLVISCCMIILFSKNVVVNAAQESSDELDVAYTTYEEFKGFFNLKGKECKYWIMCVYR